MAWLSHAVTSNTPLPEWQCNPTTAYVLSYTVNMHDETQHTSNVVFFAKPTTLGKVVCGDAKLGADAGCLDVMMVAAPCAGVDAQQNLY